MANGMFQGGRHVDYRKAYLLRTNFLKFKDIFEFNIPLRLLDNESSKKR